PPFREAEFDILYGEGISREGDVLDVGVAMGLVEKSGAWYAVGDVRLGQGKENARQYLKEHPELTDELERKIREAMGWTVELLGEGAEADAPAKDGAKEEAPLPKGASPMKPQSERASATTERGGRGPAG